MIGRTRAREIVLQLLYQAEFNETENQNEMAFLKSRLQGKSALVDFATTILQGFREHQTEIDSHLDRLTSNWDLDRTNSIDRNVMRLGAFELLYFDTPYQVVLDECINLAKRFGTEASGPFVNGVLDRLRKEKSRLSLSK